MRWEPSEIDNYNYGGGIDEDLNMLLLNNHNPCPSIETIWGRQDIILPDEVVDFIIDDEEQGVISEWEQGSIKIEWKKPLNRRCICKVIFSHIKVCKWIYMSKYIY